MAELIPIFSTTEGLNTKCDPTRFMTDKTGSIPLVKAVNICYDDTGRISRRKGYTKRVSGNCHSLYADNNICLVVKDGYLCVLNSDYTTKQLVAVKENKHLAYTRIGEAVYFCNDFQNGIYEAGNIYPWEVGTYTGEDTARVFGDIPRGHFLMYHAGKIFVAHENCLYYSEPYEPGLFDLQQNCITFESRISLLVSVQSGFYVGDQKKVYFIAGTNTDNLESLEVHSYPAVEGTGCSEHCDIVVTRDGSIFLAPSMSKDLVAFWVSSQGIVCGGPTGLVYCLTDDKLVLPETLTGCSFVNKDQIFVTLNP